MNLEKSMEQQKGFCVVVVRVVRMVSVVLFCNVYSFASTQTVQKAQKKTDTVRKQTATSPFIIKQEACKPKARSKRGLKEDMGQVLQDVMQVNSSLNKSLGVLQLKLAQMQSQFISTGKALLENKKPIKRASKDALRQGVNVLQQTARQLNEQVRHVESVTTRLVQTDVLKNNDLKRRSS
jgi:hypothetical protein